MPAWPPSPSTTSPDGALSTPARLLGLAQTITTVPADTKDPATYPYSAVHTQQWYAIADTTTARDVTVWRAADGTARIQSRALPPRHGPARFPDEDQRRHLVTAPAEAVDYPRADGTRLGSVTTEPIPDDPHDLAEALYGHHGGRCRIHLLLDRYVLLAGQYHLNHAQRAAALRMLATIPGLAYDGIARDLTGRTGWSFTLTHSQTSDTILLHPTTGALWAASTATTTGELLDHTLYLATDRTSAPGQPPSP